MAGEVQLTCSLHKDNVQVFVPPQAQLAYVLLEMMPTQVVANVKMPLNFCFVLDQSGSMYGEKMDALKEAVKYAIDLLQPDDMISIVAFSDSPHVVVPSRAARDKNQLKREVDRLDADGGTEMAPAMRAGMREVQKNLANNRINRLVLLTDGQTVGEPDCLREADQASNAGVQVIALGLGTDWNEQLLEDVGQRSSGKADFINQPSEIGAYFQEEVQTMQGAVVQNALLTLRMIPGIMPRKVWRVAPLIADLGVRPMSDRDVQVSLGELVKDQGQGILVELMLPPRTDGRYRIAQADVSYDVPLLRLTGEHARADIVVGYTSTAAASRVNPRVMNIVEKVTAFKLQTRALTDAQSGDHAGATQKLRQAATMLLNQGETDLARTMNLEADNLEKQGQMSEEGKKTIKFQGGKTVKLG